MLLFIGENRNVVVFNSAASASPMPLTLKFIELVPSQNCQWEPAVFVSMSVTVTVSVTFLMSHLFHIYISHVICQMSNAYFDP